MFSLYKNVQLETKAQKLSNTLKCICAKKYIKAHAKLAGRQTKFGL